MNLIKRVIASVAIALGVLSVPLIAFADDGPPTVVNSGAQAVTGNTFVSLTLTATIVAFLLSYVIPILTAFITQSSASVNTKHLVTAALSAIAGLIEGGVVNDGTSVLSKESILFAVGSFVLANVDYVTFWKPRGLNDSKAVAPTKGLR